MTANDDKSVTSTNHISFDIDRPCKVYVAYDSRATPPTWLSTTFSLNSSLTIGVSDSDMGYFKVYEKSFSPGPVNLGGNNASGASGAGSNYIVIVVEQ